MSTISKSELRRFGLTIGTTFVLLAAGSWIRGHTIAPRALSILGACLTITALVAPAWLRWVQRLWMTTAGVLGQFNTRLILAALFYFVITPIAVILRLVRDPLSRSFDHCEGSFWVRRDPQTLDPARYERQF